MTTQNVLDVLQDAFLVMLRVGAPVLIIALVIGLVVSILQATTQIQEQTLSFVPKLFAILLTLVLLGNFMLNTLISFTERLFTIIAGL
ncbi:flagellar biosynthesis protein FliQ [Marinilactibacillus psychrotolerans]|uniref:Flagellar biosynthetic protein FliQ n=1 Tax=Marinilactibacillus psychrotolerans TaxID=191770 RepID=A0A511GY77_9LACT|nr:flagellar biosynthesis protein FliQ [Marinilactibacillus psychrotolerans]TLQ09345.1 flagellar biosynthesis protein FliQ [Marinilactibacillus psychrotolerans]GEL66221.1 flagellar biosynthetic protein FliQ [Marinilactibacillus psychrotolerans]GEQ35036.1 flagellar biosynthesis protein, FliQ [Marinilactibacillus psychrotolerans]SDC26673.1 flagellar biosynthetic protein FliQ [Marinilactibacillus psychrotolerans]